MTTWSDCQSGVVNVRDGATPCAPDLQLTLRLPANPAHERLSMGISDDDGWRIAALLDSPRFAYQTSTCPLDQ